MVQFGSTREKLERLGMTLVGVSTDSPFAHRVWSDQLEPGYRFLSDWNREASQAFRILANEAFDCYRPLNTRAAFLVDRDGIVRYAEVTEPTVLPSAEAALGAARALQGR